MQRAARKKDASQHLFHSQTYTYNTLGHGFRPVYHVETDPVYTTHWVLERAGLDQEAHLAGDCGGSQTLGSQLSHQLIFIFWKNKKSKFYFFLFKKKLFVMGRYL